MKLYRLAHKDLVFQLENNPLLGCVSNGKHPFFCAFDSVASAILESCGHRTLGKLSPNLCFVEFRLPDHCWISTIHDEAIIDPSGGIFSGSPGARARQFLQDKKALVAAFPSLHWQHQLNYLINPRHPLFKEITITKILPCI